MGPLRCLGHRTLVTDEEGPCAAWMFQLAELRAPVGGKIVHFREGVVLMA